MVLNGASLLLPNCNDGERFLLFPTKRAHGQAREQRAPWKKVTSYRAAASNFSPSNQTPFTFQSDEKHRRSAFFPTSSDPIESS